MATGHWSQDHNRPQPVTGHRPQATTHHDQPPPTNNTKHQTPNTKHQTQHGTSQMQNIAATAESQFTNNTSNKEQHIVSFATEFIFPMNYKCQIANEHRSHRQSCYIFENINIDFIQHQHDRGENDSIVCCFIFMNSYIIQLKNVQHCICC